MRHLLPILLVASCTWQGGESTARCELSYRPYFLCGQPGILPRMRRVWYPLNGRIETADGVPDGPDAVIINGVRVEVRKDGRAK